MTERRQESWHLSKGVPIALIFTIMFQTGAIIWWASQLSFQQRINTATIEELKRSAEKQQAVTDRVVRIETLLQGVLQTLQEIKNDMRRENGGR